MEGPFDESLVDTGVKPVFLTSPPTAKQVEPAAKPEAVADRTDVFVPPQAAVDELNAALSSTMQTILNGAIVDACPESELNIQQLSAKVPTLSPKIADFDLMAFYHAVCGSLNPLRILNLVPTYGRFRTGGGEVVKLAHPIGSKKAVPTSPNRSPCKYFDKSVVPIRMTAKTAIKPGELYTLTDMKGHLCFLKALYNKQQLGLVLMAISQYPDCNQLEVANKVLNCTGIRTFPNGAIVVSSSFLHESVHEL